MMKHSSMFNECERFLKRVLKDKGLFSKGAVIAYLITGGIGFVAPVLWGDSVYGAWTNYKVISDTYTGGTRTDDGNNNKYLEANYERRGNSVILAPTNADYDHTNHELYGIDLKDGWDGKNQNFANTIVHAAELNRDAKESVILGYAAVGSGRDSYGQGYFTAIGSRSRVYGSQGTAVGNATLASDQATAVGSDVYATGSSSIAIGSDDISSKYVDKLTDTMIKEIYGNGDASTDDEKKLFKTRRLYSSGIQDKAERNDTVVNWNKFKYSYFGENAKYNPTFAGGSGAIAIGSRSIASEDGSTAIGTLSYALAEGATAMGLRAFTAREAIGSVAIGEESRTFAKQSLSVGNHNEATQIGAMSYGYNAKAVGKGSLAFGYNAFANAFIDNDAEYKNKHPGENSAPVSNIIKTNVLAQNQDISERDALLIRAHLENIQLYKEAQNKAVSASYNQTQKDTDVRIAKGNMDASEEAVKKINLTSTNELSLIKAGFLAGQASHEVTKKITALVNGVTNQDNKGNITSNKFSLDVNKDKEYMTITRKDDKGKDVKDTIYKTRSTGDNAIAIGYYTNASGNSSIAQGSGSYVEADSGIGIGSLTYVDAKAANSIAIGVGAQVRKENSIAFGTQSGVYGAGSMGLGPGARVIGDNSVAFGYGSIVKANAAMGLGVGSRIEFGATNSMSIGNNSMVGVNATSSIAFGEGSNVTASSAVALGRGASADFDNSVALGYRSNTFYYGNPNTREASVTSTINDPKDTAHYNKNKATNVHGLDIAPYLPDSAGKGIKEKLAHLNTAAAGYVSVGGWDASVDENGKPLNNNAQLRGLRRIVNVAPGALDTDAVTVAQLREWTDKSAHFLSLAGAENKSASDYAAINDPLGMRMNDPDRPGHKKAVPIQSNFDNTGASGDRALALGVYAYANGERSVALGANSYANSDYGVALGNSARTWSEGYNGNAGIAVGSGSQANYWNAMAMGTGTSVSGYHSLALGAESKVGVIRKVDEMGNVMNVFDANGKSYDVDGDVAYERKVIKNADGSETIQIIKKLQYTKQADNTYRKTAINQVVSEQDETKINDALAIGHGASIMNTRVTYEDKGTDGRTTIKVKEASSQGSIAIGANANVTGSQNSIALGLNSKVEYNDTKAKTPAAFLKDSTTASKYEENNDPGNGVVSVGNSGGVKRRIINVAGGSNDYDAVNVKQLKAVKSYYYSVNSTEATDNKEVNGIAGINSNRNNDGATGSNAVAIGSYANATAGNSLALGREVVTQGSNAVGIGYAVTSSASSGVAIGSVTKALGDDSVALGSNAITGYTTTESITNPPAGGPTTRTVVTGATEGVAIGKNATVESKYTVAIGGSAKVLRDSSNNDSESSVAIGASARVEGAKYSVALGLNSKVVNSDTKTTTTAAFTGETNNDPSNGVVSIGSSDGLKRRLINVAGGANDYDAVNVKQLKATAVKYYKTNSTDTTNRTVNGIADVNANYNGEGATGTASVTLGSYTQASGNYSTAIGRDVITSGKTAVGVGTNVTASGEGSVGMGFEAKATAGNAVAIGRTLTASGANSTAIGTTVTTSGSNSFGAGSNVTVSKNYAVGLGYQATASGDNAIAIGSSGQSGANVQATANNAIAIGTRAKATADSAVAVGRFADAQGENAVALGNNTVATTKNSVAIGESAKVQSGQGSVALGWNSMVTDDDVKYHPSTEGKTKASPYLLNDEVDKMKDADNGVISIGRKRTSGDNSSLARRIVGVAGGYNDYDAVNVKQLKAAAWGLAIQNAGATTATDVKTKNNKVTLKAGNNVTLATNATDGTVTINASGGLNSITSADENVLGVSTTAGAVTLTPKLATTITGTGTDANKLVTSSVVNTAIGNIPITSFKADAGGGTNVAGVFTPSSSKKQVNITGAGSDGTTRETWTQGSARFDSDNIGTHVNSDGRILVGLKNKVAVNEVATYNYASDGARETTQGPTLSFTGLDMKNKKITNVADGEINATSKDAINGSQLHSKLAEKADKTTVDTLTGKVNTNTTNITNLQAAVGKAITFKGNDSQGVAKTLGEALSITGEGTVPTSTNTAANNITTKKLVDGSGLQIGLAEALTNMKSITGKNGFTISSGGTGTGTDIATMTFNPKKTTGGNTTEANISVNNVKLTGLKDATLSDSSTDAVTGKQLNATNTTINNLTKQVTKNTNNISNLTNTVNQNANLGYKSDTDTTGRTVAVTTGLTFKAGTGTSAATATTVKKGIAISTETGGIVNIGLDADTRTAIDKVATLETAIGKTGADGLDGKPGTGTDAGMGKDGLTGADGMNGKDLTSKVNALRNGEAGTVVYTDESGNRVVKANDGKWYSADKVNDDGSKKAGATEITNVQARLVNPTGSTTTATKLSNIADGTIAAGSHDAVTGGQLYTVKQDVASNTQNIATNTQNINSLTTKVNTNTTDIADLKTNVDKAITFSADTGANATRKLGSTLAVKGGTNFTPVTTGTGITPAGTNIQVKSDPTNGLTVHLANTLTGMKGITGKDGLTISSGGADADVAKMTFNPKKTAGGTTTEANITVNNVKLTGLAGGEVKTGSTDAVTGGQLVDELAKKADATALNDKVDKTAERHVKSGSFNATNGTITLKMADGAGTEKTGEDVTITGIPTTLGYKANDDKTAKTVAVTTGLTFKPGTGTSTTTTTTVKKGIAISTETDGVVNIGLDADTRTAIDKVSTLENAIGTNGSDGRDGKPGTGTGAGMGKDGLTGSDGLNGKDLTSKVNALRNGEAGTVVYTDENGNRVVKATDGKWYLADKVKADGTKADDATEVTTVQARLVNPDGTTVPKADAVNGAATTKLSNIAEGAITSTSNDAVTGRQLHKAKTELATALGGNAAVDANGVLTGPTYRITKDDGTTGKDTVTNVGAAVDKLDARINTLKGNPLTFSADTGTAATRKLGSTLAVKGGDNFTPVTTGANQTPRGTNIQVKSDDTDGLTVHLADTLTNMKGISGNGTDPLTITNGDTTITVKPSKSKDGTNPAVPSTVDFGGAKLTTTANAENDSDVTNKKYVDDKIAELNRNVDGNATLNFAGNVTKDEHNADTNKVGLPLSTGVLKVKGSTTDNDIVTTAKDDTITIGLHKDVKDQLAKLGNTASDGRDGKSGTASGTTTAGMGAQGPTGADGLNGKTVTEKVNALRNGEAGTVVYTDDQGNRLVKANDGKWYNAKAVDDNGALKPTAQLPAGVTATAVDHPQARLVNPDGTTVAGTDNKAVTKLSNIAEGAITATSNDAVTGRQLHAVKESVATNTTNIATNTGDIATLKSTVGKAITFTGDDNQGVKRTLDTTLTIKGGENFTPITAATATTATPKGVNIRVEKDTTAGANGLTVKLADTLTNMKGISGTGTNDLVIKNGDYTTITVKPGTAAPAGGSATPGTVDFGGSKLINVGDATADGDVTNKKYVDNKVAGLNLGYKAETEAAKSVAVTTGLTFKAGTGTIAPTGLAAGTKSTTAATDSVATKKGIKITTDTDGVVNIGLDADTRKVIDQAAKLGDTAVDGRDGKAANGNAGAAGNAGDHGLTGKDGLNGKDLTTKVNALRNGEAGTVVYTDDQGNRLVKANDGKYYKADDVKADGTVKTAAEAGTTEAPSPVTNPQARLVNPDGTTTPNATDVDKKALTKLSNIAEGTISDKSNDAVTGRQLHEAKKEIGDIIGGTTINGNGKITGPTFTVTKADGTDETTTTVKGAIDKLNTANKDQNTKISNLETNVGKAITFVGDHATNDKIDRHLGETLNIKGQNNISVTKANGSADTLNVSLASDLKNITSISSGEGTGKPGTTLTLGADNVTITNTQAPATGATAGVTKTVTIGKDGINAGGMKITNVAKATNKDDAANKEYVDEAINSLTTKVTNNANLRYAGDTNVGATAGEDHLNLALATGTLKVAGTTDQIKTEANNGTITLSLHEKVTKQLEKLGNTASDGRDGKSGTASGTTAAGIGAQGPTGADGLNGKTVTEKVNALRNGEAGTVVYTDDKGNRLIRATDGKFYKAAEVNANGVVKTDVENGGTAPVAVNTSDVIASLVSPDGSTVPPTTATNTTKAAVTKLSNIAEGAITSTSNDAVTGRQLHKAKTELATALGGNATVNTDGTLKAPTYKITNDANTATPDEVNNVGAAVTKLDERITAARTYTDTTVNNAKTALTSAGLDFKGDDGNKVHRNLKEELTIKGGENFIPITAAAATTATPVGVNIRVEKDATTGANGLTVKLADTLTNMKGISGTGTDNLVIKNGDNAVITVKAPTGTDTKGTVDFGGTKLTNLGTGTIGAGSTDAVTGGQLHTELEKKANKDLDNLSNAGTNKVKELAQGAVKVAAGKNAMVTADDSTPNATTYVVDANDTTVKAASNEIVVSGGTLNAARVREFTVGLSQDVKDKLNNLGKIGNTVADGRDGKTADGSGTTAGDHGLTGKDGLNGKDLTTKVNALRNGEAGTVVYTDDKGNRLVKTNDGKWYPATAVGDNGELKPVPTGGTAPAEVKAKDVVASLVSPDGTTTNATTVLNNVGSALASIQKDTATKAEDTNYLDKLAKATENTSKVANSVVNVTDLKKTADAIIDKGLTFKGNDGTDIPKALGSTLSIVGEGDYGTPAVAPATAAKNIFTKHVTENNVTRLEIGLAKNLVGITSIANETDTTKPITKVDIVNDGITVTNTQPVPAGAAAGTQPVVTKTTIGKEGVKVGDTVTLDKAGMSGNGTDSLTITNGANTKITVNPSTATAAKGTVDFGGARITNIADPTTGTDAVNKDYVDGKIGNVAEIGYKANAETTTNKVAVGTGLHFKSGTGTIAPTGLAAGATSPTSTTDGMTTKTGIAISTEAGGIVNIGLDEATRKVIDKAAKLGDTAVDGRDGKPGTGANAGMGRDGLTGADGMNGKDLTSKVNALRNGEAGTVVYTDDQGNRLVKADDGKFYKADDVDEHGKVKTPATGDPAPVGLTADKVIASLVSPDGTTAPKATDTAKKAMTKLSNIAEGAITSTSNDAVTGRQIHDERINAGLIYTGADGKQLFKQADGTFKQLDGTNYTGATDTVYMKVNGTAPMLVTNVKSAVAGIATSATVKDYVDKLDAAVTNADKDRNATTAVNVSDLKETAHAIIDKGLTFQGNDGTAISKTLGSTLEIVGEGTGATTTAADNIRTKANNGKLEIGLVKDLKHIDSITAGSPTVGLMLSNGGDPTATTGATGKNTVAITDGATTFTNEQPADPAVAGSKATTSTVTLGKDGTAEFKHATNGTVDNTVTIDSKSGTVTAGKDADKQVTVNGTDGTITTGNTVVNGSSMTIKDGAVTTVTKAGETEYKDGDDVTTVDTAGVSISDGMADVSHTATESTFNNDANHATYSANGSVVTDGANTATHTATNSKFEDDANHVVTTNAMGMTVTDGTNSATVVANGITLRPSASGTGTVSLTTSGLDNGGNRITHVAAPTANDDAANKKYVDDRGTLRYAADSTVDEHDAAVANHTVNLLDGTLAVNGTADKVVTKATKDGITIDLADAVNKKLAQLDAKNSDGRDGKLGSEAGAIASAGVTKADGLNETTTTYKVNALRNGEAGSVVYTDADGNRLVKATDGKFYKATDVDANGNVKAPATGGTAPVGLTADKVIASLVSPDGTTAPDASDANKKAMTKLSNIAEGAITSTSNDAVTGRQIHAAKKELATVLGGNASITDAGVWTGPTFKVTKDDNSGTKEDVHTVDDAITKLDTRINTTNTNLENAKNDLIDKGLDFYGNDAAEATGKVHRKLGEKLTLEGAGNFTRGATESNNIKVERKATADGFDIKLAENLANMKEIAGNGTNDLVIKNGTNKITITAGKAATGTTPADPGTVDFGDAKVTVKNLDASITYRANGATDADAKTVKLQQGLDFVAGTGTIGNATTGTDAETTKKGIAITTGENGKVYFGLDADTRKTIDNAAKIGNTASDGRDGKTADGTGVAAGDKGATGKDGLNGKDLTNKVNALRNGEAGSVVYTDADGNRLVKANDGKYYKANEVKDDGTVKTAAELGVPDEPKAVDKPQARVVNSNGETTAPIAFGNIASSILHVDAKDDNNVAITNPQFLDRLKTAAKTNGAKHAAVNVTDLYTTANDIVTNGLDFYGNDATDAGKVHRNIGTALKVQGADNFARGTTDTNNIKVERNANGDGFDVKLAENLTKMKEVAGNDTDNLVLRNGKDDATHTKVEIGTNKFTVTNSTSTPTTTPGTAPTVTTGKLEMDADGTTTFTNSGAPANAVAINSKNGTVTVGSDVAGQPANTNKVVVNGSNATITAGTGANAITTNGSNATLTVGGDGTTNHANHVTINGTTGTITTGNTTVNGSSVSVIAGTKSVVTTESGTTITNGTVTTTATAGKTKYKDGNNETTVGTAGMTVTDGTNNATYSAGEATLTDGTRTATHTATSSTYEDGTGKSVETTASGITAVDGTDTASYTASGSTFIDADGTAMHTAAGTTFTNADHTVTHTANGSTFEHGTNVGTYTAGGATLVDGTTSATHTAGVSTYTDGTNTVAVGTAGITITPSAAGGATSSVSLTTAGLNNGGNVIANVAAGTVDTDAVNLKQLKAGKTTFSVNDKDGTTTNHNLVLTTTKDATDGHTHYDVKLADKVTLGKDANAVTVDGTNGSITAGKDGNAVTVDGTKAKIVAGTGTNAVTTDGTKALFTVGGDETTTNTNKVTVNGTNATITAGTTADKAVTIDGANGKITTGKTEVTGSAVTIKDAANDAKKTTVDATGTTVTDGAGKTVTTTAESVTVTDGTTTTTTKAGETKLESGDNVTTVDTDGLNIKDGTAEANHTATETTFDNGDNTATYSAETATIGDGKNTATHKATGSKYEDENNNTTETNADGTIITKGTTTTTATAGSTIYKNGMNETTVNTTNIVVKDGTATTTTKAGETKYESNGKDLTVKTEGITVTDGNNTGSINAMNSTFTNATNGTQVGATLIRVNGKKAADGSVTTDGIAIGHHADVVTSVATATKETGNFITGLDNKTWDPKTNGIVSGRAATEDQLKVVDDKVNKGRVFSADTLDANKKPVEATVGLGDTLSIVGGAKMDALTDKNIGVELKAAETKNGKVVTPATMTVKLAKDVQMGDGSTTYNTYLVEYERNPDGSLKADNNNRAIVAKNADGSTKYQTDAKGNKIALRTVTHNGDATYYTRHEVDKNGHLMTDAKGNPLTNVETGIGANGIEIASGPQHNKPSVTLTSNGLNNGGNRITNVAPGVEATDAVNVGQVNSITTVLDRRINQTGAKAAAMAAMKPLMYDPLKKSQIMAGFGTQKGAQALALGVAHYFNEDVMVNMGLSVGAGDNMMNAGVTYRFGGDDSMIPERYKGGPISSIYVMQDEISALKAENEQVKSENAQIKADNSQVRADNERMKASYEKIMEDNAQMKQDNEEMKAQIKMLMAHMGIK